MPDERNGLVNTKSDKISVGQRIAIDADGFGVVAKAPDTGIGVSVTNSAGYTMIVRRDGAYVTDSKGNTMLVQTR